MSELIDTIINEISIHFGYSLDDVILVYKQSQSIDSTIEVIRSRYMTVRTLMDDYERELDKLQEAYGKPIDSQLLARLLERYSLQYIRSYVLEFGKLPQIVGPSEVKK